MSVALFGFSGSSRWRDRYRRWIVVCVLAGTISGVSGNSASAGAQSPERAAVTQGAKVGTSSTTTAFINVAVIPMDRERVLSGQTVLVRDGRIVAIGPFERIQVPVTAVRIDGRGKFLVPGLADMHMHLQFADSATAETVLLLLVANGVTTIRNVDYVTEGAFFGQAKLSPEMLLRLRARAQAGMLLSPRIYTSGPWATRVGGPFQLPLGTPEDVPVRLPAYKAASYDFIKIHDESPDTFDSLVVVAHRLGIPVMGHVPDNVTVQQALAGHYRSIEHLTGYIPAFARGRSAIPSMTPAQMRALALATREAGTWNCPTQALKEIGFADDSALNRWPELAYMTPETRSEWHRGSTARDSASRAQRKAYLQLNRDFIKTLQLTGAGLLSGTDASTPYLVPGFSIHRELEALVRAGLTPYQALLTSTRNVAEYFGTGRESGTVAVGNRADLVLLNGNPLRDIRQTMQPAGVMLHGRWLPRREIDDLLAPAVGTVNAVVQGLNG